MTSNRTSLQSVLSFIVVLLLLLMIPIVASAQGERGGDTNRRAIDGSSANPLDPPIPSRVDVESLGNGAGAPMGSRGFNGKMSTGTLGATVGGAQDIGYARQTIERGVVPASIDFSPEGLYSEHDIPTPESDCDQRLCLSLGYGYSPMADNSSNALLVQLGMSSNIKAEGFHRLPLRLAVVIDRSGSMRGGSMIAVKEALHRLVARLNEQDELILVEFDDRASVVLSATRCDDTDAINNAIDAIEIGGGTNIESGLLLGYEALAALPNEAGTMKRLMLFTDARPNAGRTDKASFHGLTEQYAKDGIGLTAFGVGVSFGQDLIYHISQLRGCNFFFLESREKIAQVFDKEFDYMVTPLVYDLDVRIATPDGLKLTGVYGLPTWKPGDRDAVLHIPTVFLSSNRGAIVLRYERDGEGTLAFSNGDLLASGTLSYTSLDLTEHHQQTELRHTGTDRIAPGTQFYTHNGMRLAAALTNVYFALRDGCSLYNEGKQKEAIAAIQRGRALVILENLALQDEGLTRELALLEKLEATINQSIANK